MAKALNYEEIVKHAERTTKIQYIINKWKGRNFPSETEY